MTTSMITIELDYNEVPGTIQPSCSTLELFSYFLFKFQYSKNVTQGTLQQMRGRDRMKKRKSDLAYVVRIGP